MESLYALSINGAMLYMSGNLSDQECSIVEDIATHMQFKKNNEYDNELEIICQALIDTVSSLHNIDLKQLPVKCVFRINTQD